MTVSVSTLRLVIGVSTVFSAIACVLLVYGYFFGVSGSATYVVTSNGLSFLVVLMFLVLVLGIAGGYQIAKSSSR